MSGDTVCEAPRRYNAAAMRAHDYLYDSAYIVSGAKDYARSAFKAAMASAQMGIQPYYKYMFSELRSFPRARVVYHPNCRLPSHMDRSYAAYVAKVSSSFHLPPPQLAGKDRFKFAAIPKKVLDVKSATPDFHPPSPRPMSTVPGKPRSRGTQSVYRESSAQTTPWQPDAKPADHCEGTPEVMFLDKLEWGPGSPYRTGDLPADFHTTEIINKMRHARIWNEVVDKGAFPRWMKKTDAIIGDVEMKDWIFREAEIDELQSIRLALLHRIQSGQRSQRATRIGRKLANLWDCKKREMEKKVDHIRHTRDRELRKLSALHGGGGRTGLVAKMRASRGHAAMIMATRDPASDLYAPVARHGYQARRRHAEITYDPSLLCLEDHKSISEPPAWLQACGQDLTRTCSGHHLPRDTAQLCQRETKWSEQFLEGLHNDLKKARLGAATTTAGPLHVLKPRRVFTPPRPTTPEVDAVPDEEEEWHQAALVLQRVIRGRAVQTLMYEGRTRAAELTEELKTTHGLQKEDRQRIAREESKAREFNAMRSESEQKEDAISALVDELCGGAVASALDFLEKELRRLKEQRRHHAFILVALREKTMREAAEAGRRQKEEHRRREHDEMFKQVIGVTQQTVDAYLQEIITEGAAIAAEEDAERSARVQADAIQKEMALCGAMSTAEQHECVAELVHQLLLPEAHKRACRQRVSASQHARVAAATQAVFGVVDAAGVGDKSCVQCGMPLGALCRCVVCPTAVTPADTEARDDHRWRHTRSRPKPPEKTASERFPPQHDVRCMLNAIVDDAVVSARREKYEHEWLERELKTSLKERVEAAIDAKEMVNFLFDSATGVIERPVRDSSYKYTMRRVIVDALDRTEPFARKPCPDMLPSEIRRIDEEAAALNDPSCRCKDEQEPTKEAMLTEASNIRADKSNLLPSQLRALEEMMRCKCDTDSSPSSLQRVDSITTALGTEVTESTTGLDEHPEEDLLDK